MNATIFLLATAVMATAGEEQAVDRFPSPDETYVALREINDDFLMSASGRDNWKGFVPLFERVVKYQGAVPKDEMSKTEKEIVARFVLYSFACEHDTDPVKADFSGRLDCVRLLSQFDLVRRDTNTLFRLADWLSDAVPLAVDRASRDHEMEAAFQKDMAMIYGGRTPPRYPGSVGNTKHWGPAVRACDAKFRFRRTYNERLCQFRADAMAYILKSVAPTLSEAERESVWAEFIKRVQTIRQQKVLDRTSRYNAPEEKQND